MPLVERGFVVAMHAVISLHRTSRAAFPGRPESRRFNIWLIMARFGRLGEFLTLSYAGRCRGGVVPLGLDARLTAVARRDDGPASAGPPPFTILPSPPGLTIAGRPLALAGRAQLIGRAPEIGLLAAGETRHGLQWGVLAWRRPWIGEVVEADAAPVLPGPRWRPPALTCWVDSAV